MSGREETEAAVNEGRAAPSDSADSVLPKKDDRPASITRWQYRKERSSSSEKEAAEGELDNGEVADEVGNSGDRRGSAADGGECAVLDHEGEYEGGGSVRDWE